MNRWAGISYLGHPTGLTMSKHPPKRSLFSSLACWTLALLPVSAVLVLPAPLALAEPEAWVGAERDGHCTSGAHGQEEFFYADVDSDGQNEVILARTFATGVGHDGALDQLEICVWDWTGSELEYLGGLSEEFTKLGLKDAESVSAHLLRKEAGEQGWRPLVVKQQEQLKARERQYAIGKDTFQMTQTGAYFVGVAVLGQPSTRPFELVGMTAFDVRGASRVWDFSDSWELRTIDGEPDCCSFDVRAGAKGAPRITQAWSHQGSTYAVLRQEQSKVVPACMVIQASAGTIITHSTDCEGFLAARGT